MDLAVPAYLMVHVLLLYAHPHQLHGNNAHHSCLVLLPLAGQTEVGATIAKFRFLFAMYVLSGACKFEKAKQSRNVHVAVQPHVLHRSYRCLFDFMASMSRYGRAIQCTCSPSLSLSGSRMVRAPGRVTYMPQEVGWKPITG